MNPTSSPHVVTTLEDTEAIRSVLETDRRMSAYALADLDPPYRQNARFIGAIQDGSPTAVLLLYRLPTAFALLPNGDIHGIEAVFEEEVDLPDTVFLLAHRDYLPAVRKRYHILDSCTMDRMVVESPHLRIAPPVDRPVQQLTETDFSAIRKLYTYADNVMFDEAMFHAGVCCGVFDGTDLIAVSGTHVVSQHSSLACIGGVFTHPDYRGHGLATATTGEVTRILAGMGISLIALNVKDDNVPAIAAYARLGFQKHDSYFEGSASARSIAM